MDYLNRDELENLAAGDFQNAQPYPWLAVERTIVPQGFERLCETLPQLEEFDRHEGVKRAHGQQPHDRYMLHYHAGLKLAEPWRDFLAELDGPEYRAFLSRMLGQRSYILTFSWHYAWQGCSVSPHCDAARKRATHIFYFNRDEDWDPAWGGETLILDDRGRFATHSAPGFDDFEVMGGNGPQGNCSLLFQRTPHSWHGMKPLQCPPGRLRRIFCVTVNVVTAQVLWRRVRGKNPEGFRLSDRAVERH